MTREIVKDHTGLVKIDGCFVVNEDDDAYKLALSRRAKAAKEQELEGRVSNLENKLDLIIGLLQQKV